MWETSGPDERSRYKTCKLSVSLNFHSGEDFFRIKSVLHIFVVGTVIYQFVMKLSLQDQIIVLVPFIPSRFGLVKENPGNRQLLVMLKSTA